MWFYPLVCGKTLADEAHYGDGPPHHGHDIASVSVSEYEHYYDISGEQHIIHPHEEYADDFEHRMLHGHKKNKA